MNTDHATRYKQRQPASRTPTQTDPMESYPMGTTERPDRTRAYQRLGRAIADARQAADMTHRAAAERAGVASSTWLRLEHGGPGRDSTYERVALVLGWPAGLPLRLLDEPDDDEARLDRIEAQVTLLENSVMALITSLARLAVPQILALTEAAQNGDRPESTVPVR